MEIRFNRSGKERKELVMAMAEILEVDAIYKGVPSCSYKVADYIIDKIGTITIHESANSGKVEQLLEALLDRGFEAEVVIQEKEPEKVEMNIQMPLSFFTEEVFSNLDRIIEAKGTLIKKALGINSLPVIREEDKVSFPWFSKASTEVEAFKAYAHFITSICEMAKKQKCVSLKDKPIENEKYAFRCFLLRLGFIGDEYKTERKILLQNLDGYSAFKGGAKV